eukprot:6772297-Karenia_brevis.AAC.1
MLDKFRTAPQGYTPAKRMLCHCSFWLTGNTGSPLKMCCASDKSKLQHDRADANLGFVWILL